MSEVFELSARVLGELVVLVPGERLPLLIIEDSHDLPGEVTHVNELHILLAYSTPVVTLEDVRDGLGSAQRVISLADGQGQIL